MRYSSKGPALAPKTGREWGIVLPEESDHMPQPKQKDGLPEGWTRQALQLPTPLSRAFREYGAMQGQGEIKNVGTVAIALALGMPQMVREAMVVWAIQAYRIDPARVTPERAWTVFLGSLRAWLTAAISAESVGMSEETRAFWEGLIADIVEHVKFEEEPHEQGVEEEPSPEMMQQIMDRVREAAAKKAAGSKASPSSGRPKKKGKS